MFLQKADVVALYTDDIGPHLPTFSIRLVLTYSTYQSTSSRKSSLKRSTNCVNEASRIRGKYIIQSIHLLGRLPSNHSPADTLEQIRPGQ